MTEAMTQGILTLADIKSIKERMGMELTVPGQEHFDTVGHVVEENKEMITQIGDTDTQNKYDFIHFKDKAQSGFYNYDSEWGYMHCNEVIAWMPLPTLYKA